MAHWRELKKPRKSKYAFELNLDLPSLFTFTDVLRAVLGEIPDTVDYFYLLEGAQYGSGMKIKVYIHEEALATKFRERLEAVAPL